MKVYTKTGDKGETGLVGGTRISKDDIRLEAYGDVDELNSHLGAVRSHMETAGRLKKEDEVLREVQNALFTLGSNLASESASRKKFKLPALDSAVTQRLETAIDDMEKELEPLKNFILPDGAPAAAAAHVARSVCRRVERRYVAFARAMPEELPQGGMELLNRLSDYLFVLARLINKIFDKKETIWKA